MDYSEQSALAELLEKFRTVTYLFFIVLGLLNLFYVLEFRWPASDFFMMQAIELLFVLGIALGVFYLFKLNLKFRSYKLEHRRSIIREAWSTREALQATFLSWLLTLLFLHMMGSIFDPSLWLMQAAGVTEPLSARFYSRVILGVMFLSNGIFFFLITLKGNKEVAA